MYKVFLSFIMSILLSACGGGEVITTPVKTTPQTVSTVDTQSPFVFVDGNWKTDESITGKWVVRGTTEDDAFMPANPVWYLPSHAKVQARDWWKLYTTEQGIHNEVDKVDGPELNFYSGSFINDALSVPFSVSKYPTVHVKHVLQKFEGSKARATIGMALTKADGSYYYLERNIKRTDSFKLCTDVRYDRCTTNITYFPPSEGSIDIRDLLLKSSNLKPTEVDSMSLVGVYTGSEIYGQGSVHLLVTDYKITINQ